MVWRVVTALLVVAAASLPYLPTIDDYFVQDDFGVVALLSGKPATYFPRWFVTPWMEDIWGYVPDEIRPFPALSYQIAAQWGAASPSANHLLNIVMHAVNAWLVLRVATLAAPLSAVPAAFAAIVFAVLPMQTESVAWVTGRVDSLPACFYLAAFLSFVRWRAGSRTRDYWWAVAWCFLALFSKQNTVTLAPALVLFDLVCGHPWRGRATTEAAAAGGATAAWRTVSAIAAPYLPFAVLTAGYLALRYWLFGEVARESMLTAEHLRVFATDLGVHLRRLVFGESGVAMSGWPLLLTTSAGAAVAVASAVARSRRDAWPLLAAGFYFGVIWIALGVAPTIVAGYASPRHMYLASVGWAVGVGIALESLWRWKNLITRGVVLVPALWLLASYVGLLQRDVARWGTRAMVSQRIVDDIAAEARRWPEGTLVLVGAPRRSFDFAIPHAFRPPFTEVDLPSRLRFISHSSIHCCPAIVWEPHTRRSMREWLDDPRRPPVVALYWHPESGALSRVDDTAEPFLRELVPVLLETRDVASLDSGLLDVLTKLVAGRGPTAMPR